MAGERPAVSGAQAAVVIDPKAHVPLHMRKAAEHMAATVKRRQELSERVTAEQQARAARNTPPPPPTPEPETPQ